MEQVSAQQVYEIRASGPVQLLDVREPWEWEEVHIEGSIHIPMGQILERWPELNSEQPVICICHHGMRSMQVGLFLEKQGFQSVMNLRGGIDAWAREVAPELKRY